MTAEVFSAVVRPASVFSTEKKKGGSAPLTSAAVTALAGLTTASTVADVLDILSEVVEADRVVTANSIGRATSVDNS